MNTSLNARSNLSTVFIVAMAILFITPILPQALKIVSIGSFLAVCIFDFIKHRPVFKMRYFIFNSIVYIAYVISLLYSDNFIYGLRKLEVGASLIVFPLGFALISKTFLNEAIRKLKLYFYLYIFSVLGLNILLCISFISQGNGWTNFIDYAAFVNNVNSFVRIHPMYLSMHNAVGIIMVIYLLRTERFLKTGFVLYTVGFLLGMSLIVLLQKGPVFALLVVSSLLSLRYNLRRVWAFYLVFILSLATILVAYPNSIKKLNVLLKVEKLDTIRESSEIREVLSSCNRLILREAGITGFGVGDGNEMLINCYEKTDSELALNRYNSHNQYTGLILMIGVLGLLCFLVTLLFNVNHALRNGIFLPVAIILFYAIIMFSENILERQEGVVYFSLLLNFLYFLSKENQHKPKIKQTQEQVIEAIT